MRQECIPWVNKLYFPQSCFQQLLVVVLRESLKTGQVHDGISARIWSGSVRTSWDRECGNALPSTAS